MKALCLALLIAAGPLQAAADSASIPAAVTPARAPSKLSDLYQVFTLAAKDALHADVQAWPHAVRILGRSWELMKGGVFPEVEFTLKPFEAQGLKFEKAELLFRHLVVDVGALQVWQVKLKDVREVQTRLVFTLRSLAMKLSAAQGQDLKLQADLDAQLCWSERARTLPLHPLPGGGPLRAALGRPGQDPEPGADGAALRRPPPSPAGCGGWAAARRPTRRCWTALAFSWIPFNIQEVHVGWDRVNRLSTNW